MNLVGNSKCCGCSACVSICPYHAIKMEDDREGFRYPFVDMLKCSQCGLCQSVCPERRTDKQEYCNGEAYAAFNVNKDERDESSSGGLFILLAKEIIRMSGVVYAAAFDSKLKVVHQRCVNEIELTRFVGSKYVQSNIEGCYKQIADDLKKQKNVLFVGTPCQVKSIDNYQRSP